jgi:hypothetical protein
MEETILTRRISLALAFGFILVSYDCTMEPVRDRFRERERFLIACGHPTGAAQVYVTTLPVGL